MKLLARLSIFVYVLAISGLVMLVLFSGEVAALWRDMVLGWLEHSWAYSGEALKERMEGRGR